MSDKGPITRRVVLLYGGPASGVYVPLDTPDVVILTVGGVTYLQSPAYSVFTPSGLTAGEIEDRDAAGAPPVRR